MDEHPPGPSDKKDRQVLGHAESVRQGRGEEQDAAKYDAVEGQGEGKDIVGGRI